MCLLLMFCTQQLYLLAFKPIQMVYKKYKVTHILQIKFCKKGYIYFGNDKDHGKQCCSFLLVYIRSRRDKSIYSCTYQKNITKIGKQNIIKMTNIAFHNISI